MPSPPSRPTPEPLGGRYEVLEPVGEGAFAVTYRALDLTLDRIVAVKVLRPHLAANAGFVARFKREARIAATVSDPNVVDVYDFGAVGDTFYIAMQFVHGCTLRSELEARGRFDPADGVRVTSQVLGGLAAIHAAGIVHRDVKPENVLLGPGGVARVADFGIAHDPDNRGLTGTGVALGTPAYMAPEQAQGGEVTPATDLYAVGAVLFELLTGRPPFVDAGPMAILLAHLRQPVPTPRSVAPEVEVPPALEAELLRALAKDPVRRHRSTHDMARALERAIEPQDSGHWARVGAAAAKETKSLRAAPVDAAAWTRGAAPPAVEPAMLPPVPGRRTGGRWAPVALFVLALVAAGAVVLAGVRGNGDGEDGVPPTAMAAQLAGSAPLPSPSPEAPVVVPPTRIVVAITALSTATSTATPAPTAAPAATSTPTPLPQTAVSSATPMPPPPSTPTVWPTPTETAGLAPMPSPTPALSPPAAAVTVDAEERDEAAGAAAAAVYLSQLEAAGDVDRLYDLMHLDSKAVVPRAAVVGWYAADFVPRGPEPIVVDGVRFVAWTWGVTGRTYPNAAEVRYRQQFADGTVVEDVARLVRGDGTWGWFFGRDRAFVDAQIARFSAQSTAVAGRSSPLLASAEGPVEPVAAALAADRGDGSCDEIGRAVTARQVAQEEPIPDVGDATACAAGGELILLAACVGTNRAHAYAPPRGAIIACEIRLWSEGYPELRVAPGDFALVNEDGVPAAGDPRSFCYDAGADVTDALPTGSYLRCFIDFPVQRNVRPPFLVEYLPTLPSNSPPTLTVIVEVREPVRAAAAPGTDPQELEPRCVAARAGDAEARVNCDDGPERALG